MTESTAQVQHTCSHTDSSNEQPEQTNASSDHLMINQASSCWVKAFYTSRV